MKQILGILLIAIAAFLGWWFFIRRGGRITKLADPYEELRINIGSYDPVGYDDSGMWVIMGQDFPDIPTGEATRVAKAFLKGFDLGPSTWEFRSILKDDFAAFYNQNPGLHPMEVRQAEFIL